MHRFCHCKHERHHEECEHHHKRRRHHRKHRVVKRITVRVEFIRKHNRKRRCF